jgi:hypothetical protein
LELNERGKIDDPQWVQNFIRPFGVKIYFNCFLGKSFAEDYLTFYSRGASQEPSPLAWDNKPGKRGRFLTCP